MSKRKVCVVAPVHAWDDVRVFHKEAATLAAAGYHVTVIARSPAAQTVNGVHIVPSVGSGTSRPIRFLLLPIVALQALSKKADIYHLHNPDTIPIAIFLRLFGKKVIYDTHEDFSKRILVRPWLAKPLRAPLAYCVGKAEALVTNIVTASIATQEDVVDRLDKKTLLLGNPPRVDKNIIARVNEHAQKIDRGECRLRAVYIGRIEETRGLFEMVDALELVNETDHARLWLIGPATKDDLDRAGNRPGWKYVDHLPRMQQELAFAYVACADVGLIVMRDVGGYPTIDPNKLYEYMMFGKPFVASAFDAWIRRLQDVDAGWFVKPGSAEALAVILQQIARDAETARNKGSRGKAFIRRYNWEAESQKLLALYGEL